MSGRDATKDVETARKRAAEARRILGEVTERGWRVVREGVVVEEGRRAESSGGWEPAGSSGGEVEGGKGGWEVSGRQG